MAASPGLCMGTFIPEGDKKQCEMRAGRETASPKERLLLKGSE